MHMGAIVGEDIKDSKNFGWKIEGTVTHDWDTLVENVGDYIASSSFGSFSFSLFFFSFSFFFSSFLSFCASPHTISPQAIDLNACKLGSSTTTNSLTLLMLTQLNVWTEEGEKLSELQKNFWFLLVGGLVIPMFLVPRRFFSFLFFSFLFFSFLFFSFLFFSFLFFSFLFFSFLFFSPLSHQIIFSVALPVMIFFLWTTPLVKPWLLVPPTLPLNVLGFCMLSVFFFFFPKRMKEERERERKGRRKEGETYRIYQVMTPLLW